MRYRAVIKQSGEWWIGRLVDLPGVNEQEKTRKSSSNRCASVLKQC